MPFRLSREILCQLANRYGVETSYIDGLGKETIVSNKSLVHILRGMGIDVKSNLDILNESKKYDESILSTKVEPIITVWDEGALIVKITLTPAEANKIIYCHLVLENGEIMTTTIQSTSSPVEKTVTINGQTMIQKWLFITSKLEYGYHALSLEIDGNRYNSFIISAPHTAYEANDTAKKNVGYFAPLYALRSTHHSGAGDMVDFKQFISWVATNGGKFVGTLPLYAMYFDNHFFDPSPYSPVSRLFWNEFYLAIDHPNNHENNLVDYKSIMAAKRSIIEKSYLQDISDNMVEYEQFLLANPEVNIYAAFRDKIENKNGVEWCNWTEKDYEDILKQKRLSSSYQYHRYVQWKMNSTLDEIKKYAEENNVLLYFDLPLAVSRNSYDAWRFKESFILNLNIGSPSDTFFTQGQDWGLPPLNPITIRTSHYSYFRKSLAAAMQKTHLLHVDHIMGLHHLFCIPKGEQPAEGTYIKYPAEELYALLCLESHRHQVMLVGENLETVSTYMNEAINTHHFYQTYVIQHELDSNKPISSHAIPTHCMASLNTHAMPPFAAYYKGLDLEVKSTLGLIAENKIEAEKANRQKNISEFEKSLPTLPASSAIALNAIERCLLASLLLLSSSPAQFILINIADLYLETAQQNIPSTSENTPNWRHRMNIHLEKLSENKKALYILESIFSAIRVKKD